jgi:hypothetical protein
MPAKRVPLFERLPEIYRIKDAEQLPPGQLQHYLALVEDSFSAIHENIESLYHDLFIETCDDWVIPYIGDLLGTTPLKGDPRTLRADVADTILLRRRKGTLGAIERLTYNLTRWGVHGVELRENLVWNQHLNHQRPDAGGDPPYAQANLNTVIRGGTVTLRDPAILSLLNTPFDPFAHTVDVKPPAWGNIRYNLPNLAIFLWRLAAYRVQVSQPVIRGVIDLSATATGDQAPWIVRLDVLPGDPNRSFTEPVRLFNTSRFDPQLQPPVVSQLDQTPGPIPTARLDSDALAGAPAQYVVVETYDPTAIAANPLDIGEPGLQFHLPEPEFTDKTFPPLPTDPQPWRIRGDNLCAWEIGLALPLRRYEIAIDPIIGRILIGVDTQTQAEALRDRLLLTYTYGAVGPVGAHPISREQAPEKWQDDAVILRTVNFHQNPNGLRDALNNLQNETAPVVIEIKDSMTHVLDLTTVAGVLNEDGGPNLLLNRSLIIRAADNQRPVILLAQPLRFRPVQIVGADADEQKKLDAAIARLNVRLEGLYLSRAAAFSAGEPLIARAALNQLEILSCTLDPGGFLQLDGTRAAIQTSITLRDFYGFTVGSTEEVAFKQTPVVILQKTVTGPLLIDRLYTLNLTDTILNAGKGVGDAPGNSFALSNATDSVNQYGPSTTVSGITVFGRMRVQQISGRGGIWVHALEVLNNQKGCLKFSYFSGVGDRLPQNHACVTGREANLRFTSSIFGQPAYGQLHHTSDFRIRERGPNDDAMGAFGFLLEAHKWRNLQIRYREFMPVGVRPLLIPVT